jgi:hypothetical protein
MVGWDLISRKLLKRNAVARPGRLELPTLCLEAVRSTLPNLARGVANRANSASWCKFSQTIFSFICRYLLHICRYFPRFALHFRDSHHYQPNKESTSVCACSLPRPLWCRLPMNRHRMQSPRERKKYNAHPIRHSIGLWYSLKNLASPTHEASSRSPAFSPAGRGISHATQLPLGLNCHYPLARVVDRNVDRLRTAV